MTNSKPGPWAVAMGNIIYEYGLDRYFSAMFRFHDNLLVGYALLAGVLYISHTGAHAEVYRVAVLAIFFVVSTAAIGAVCTVAGLGCVAVAARRRLKQSGGE